MGVRGKTGRKLEEFIPAMLAKDRDAPFTDDDWIFEIKWDGYRALAEVDKTGVKLYSRNGNAFNSIYPSITHALEQLNLDAVFDGEIVVMDEDGNPNFQKLQHYDNNRHLPLNYYVFDLLYYNGETLYDKPLIERKQLLQSIIPTDSIIKYSDHIEGDGESFFAAIQEKDMEGIMAKKKSSIYIPGKRSSEWLKIKHHKSDEAIIAGFTAPRGGRKYFGALVLGVYENKKLKYIGHTGSGFDTKLLKEIYNKLEPLIQDKSPFDERVKTNMPVTWVKPELVCELKFTEWTSDGKLRHPIFLRLRTDKKANQVNTTLISSTNVELENNVIVKENITAKENHSINKKAKKAVPKKASKKLLPEKGNNEKEKIITIGKTEVKTTNRTKVFFPDEGITKGDVIDYYEKIADYILPYLKDRPESLFRTPNGIKAKGFFHKDAGDEAPSFVKSIELYSESAKRTIDYILCNDKPTLLYLANLGCIEINPWHSRVKALDNPDYMIIDIDPSDNNTFEDVIEAAQVVKSILDTAGASSVCKTSGASGLHIYVPMGKKYSYDQVKDFAYLVCMLANQQLPSITTLERNLRKRKKNQIYMDYLQNRKGQTIASVYSLRPKPGATVSTPLDWKEVKKGLSPQQFNIHNIHERLNKVGDLFKPVLGKGVDLLKCLQRLEGES